MSESDGSRAPARPRQVTVAGVMAAGACALLVVSLFDSMATVRSADMRERVAEFLRTPAGDGLGLDVAGVLDLLRGVVLLSGALAAAGAVLAVYALRRHRGARIGLSVAAVVMLFTATFVSGILPVVVAVAATMLWGREARDWFDGRAPRPTPVQESADPTPPAPPSWQAEAGSARRSSPPPPATYPFGAPPGTGPIPGVEPGQPPGPPFGYPTRPARRPPALTVAAWLTWVFSGLVAFGFALVVLTVLLERDQLLAELQKNAAFAARGFSTRQVVGFLWVLSAVAIFWALSAMALAVLAFRRVETARVVLVVSAVLAGLVCLAAVPFGWLHAGAAFTCVVLLSRRSTRDWYAGGDRPWSGPPPGQRQPPAPKDKPPVW